jgi:hypothetical protein
MAAEQSELVQALRKSRESVSAAEQKLQQVLNSRSFRWLSPARRLKSTLLPPRQ